MASVEQWKIEYKQKFKQDFDSHLTRILQLDPNSEISDEDVRKVLHGLNSVAIDHAMTYIGDVPKIYFNGLEELYYNEYSDARLGGEKCLMQLLRDANDIDEYDAFLGRDDNDIDDVDEYNARKVLERIQALAIHIAKKASTILLGMMLVVNLDSRENLPKIFSDALQKLSFLKDAFEWSGRNEYSGVVYDRIIALMKHAHREFMLQIMKTQWFPMRSTLPVDDLVRDKLDVAVRTLSKLESYLSFAILPDGSRLLAYTGRSLYWLLKELQHLEVDSDVHSHAYYAGKLIKEYDRCFNYSNIETFDYRMNTVQEAMWEDMLSEVQLVKTTSKSQLYLNAEIIKQGRKSAQIRIRGINTKEEAKWYINKHIAYHYQKNERFYLLKGKYERFNPDNYYSIWGKITRPHGDTGVLHAKFKSPLIRGKRGCISSNVQFPRMRVYIGI